MVTQFHTLLHFVTQNHTILSLTASLAASTRIQGVSKSHLLSDFYHTRMFIHICTISSSGAYVCESR